MTEDVVVFVEVPSGSRNKGELDEATGALVLDRRLVTSRKRRSRHSGTATARMPSASSPRRARVGI